MIIQILLISRSGITFPTWFCSPQWHVNGVASPCAELTHMTSPQSPSPFSWAGMEILRENLKATCRRVGQNACTEQ